MKIAIAMSGGVDSSVAAYLLKQQGYTVKGFFMKNWNDCQVEKDLDDVIEVCKQIDIPYEVLDFSKEYKERVFKYFLEEYKKGNTPNPDILCNKEIKFNLLLKNIKEKGIDFLSTGHYSQIEKKIMSIN